MCCLSFVVILNVTPPNELFRDLLDEATCAFPFRTTAAGARKATEAVAAAMYDEEMIGILGILDECHNVIAGG